MTALSAAQTLAKTDGTPPGVLVDAPKTPGAEDVLTPEALAFVAELHRTFNGRVHALLAKRKERLRHLDRGGKLDFLADTGHIREGDWKVRPLPAELLDRRVEITGPVDRKMIINALNSGARVFMADFEDSSTPTWHNMIQGQRNLRDANLRTIELHDEARGKHYQLNDDPAILMVRPRGWHLHEAHVLVDQQPVAAGIFDFALYLFHNHQALKERGSGPYFYLPKLEGWLEAKLWNDIFVKAQEHLGMEVGTIKATVLIETLPGAFEMEEIIYALKDHMAGLNCGRWDYIFSFIKQHRSDPNAIMPDRGQVGMTQPFMRAYTQKVIQTCHRRGCMAIGGMAAQIPIKNDPTKSEAALAKVRADKQREADDGHDGTWVAHPGLVPVALEIFDKAFGDKENQLDVARDDFTCSADDLLAIPDGTRSEDGVRENVRVGVQYLAAWMAGTGCVPLYNLMEDAATAEISRTQVWQWLKHGATLDDGRVLDEALFLAIVDDEMKVIQGEVGDTAFKSGLYEEAKKLFVELCTQTTCPDFLTLPAYRYVLDHEEDITA